ncbi:MAG: carbon monoxide dehydrogenase subunit G [Anaerolineae bacterium]|nr:carbon monoxide dehydrogenase subunit G [Anaerolineae bacterium]
MELTGKYTFEADQQSTWDLLMNTKAIAAAMPGVQELIPVEGAENQWRAEASLKIGAIGGTYTGVISMSEHDEPSKYRLTVEGEGQASIINGTAVIELLPNSDDSNKTTIQWVAEANISGKLARVGQRLIKATANMMSKRFFSALAKMLESDSTE